MIDFRWVGRIEFSEALAFQNQLVEDRKNGAIGDTVLFLEHEPVYTIGRTRDRSSLIGGVENLPHPVVEINRGGQATYHGPGQLVGYLILDLQNHGADLHVFLRSIEEFLICFLASLDMAPERKEGLTGVWIGGKKIASIGIGVKRWISMHGFALNISSDLSGFASIVPCGIDNIEMTSLALETDQPDWTVEKAGNALIPFIESELN